MQQTWCNVYSVSKKVRKRRRVRLRNRWNTKEKLGEKWEVSKSNICAAAAEHFILIISDSCLLRVEGYSLSCFTYMCVNHVPFLAPVLIWIPLLSFHSKKENQRIMNCFQSVFEVVVWCYFPDGCQNLLQMQSVNYFFEDKQHIVPQVLLCFCLQC